MAYFPFCTFSLCFLLCAFSLAVYISSSPLIHINNMKNCNLLISHNSLDYLLSEGRWQWGWESVAFPPHLVLVGELLMAPQREEPGMPLLLFGRQSRQRPSYDSRENKILAWGREK